MVSTPWKPQQSCKSDSRSRCQKYRMAGDSLSLADISSIILNILKLSPFLCFCSSNYSGWLRNPAPVGRWLIPEKKKKTCFTAVHKNPNVPIVTNWCRISQPSTISCHLKSWLLPLDVVPKKSDTLLQEMQPTKHPGVTSPKRTWWLCIEYGKPWHFDAFWATLCTLKSHKNIPIILWHLPTGPTPIRCTRHLPHCCPARVQLLWHFNEKHTLLKIQKKKIQSPLVCHMLSYSNGHSGLFKWTNAGHLWTKTLFSAWNDWNKWKFTSTTNYKHVQMLIEI